MDGQTGRMRTEREETGRSKAGREVSSSEQGGIRGKERGHYAGGGYLFPECVLHTYQDMQSIGNRNKQETHKSKTH